ncbi:MAG: hypothetical protein ACI9KE_002585 [Polyangiales bacterium]|jgi:hypothetical protein
MQREMEVMQAQGVNPSTPLPPPIPGAQLGTFRTAFDVRMVEAIDGLGGVILATASSPHAPIRLLPRLQWHTLVAGPNDLDYAFLIGTVNESWPVVVQVRGDTVDLIDPLHYPAIGFGGPTICADP